MADTRVPMWRTQPMQQQKTGPVQQPTEQPQVTPQDGAKPDGEGDEPLRENGEKALRAERSRATAAEKRAADLEARVRAFEDANKSAEQKQADALATAQNEASTATVKALRYEVCDEQELPLKAARFLTGNTKAEIEEAARAYKELYGSGTSGKPATGLPPSPNAGRETPKPSGAEAGLAKARERFGDLVKK